MKRNMEELNKGITYLEQYELVKAHESLINVAKSDDILLRAVSHLYLGKLGMMSSTGAEWRGILHFDKSKELFDEMKFMKGDDTYEIEKAKLEREFDKISICSGSLYQYKKDLKEYLESYEGDYFSGVDRLN
jgi:hypothetical protein